MVSGGLVSSCLSPCAWAEHKHGRSVWQRSFFTSWSIRTSKKRNNRKTWARYHPQAVVISGRCSSARPHLFFYRLPVKANHCESPSDNSIHWARALRICLRNCCHGHTHLYFTNLLGFFLKSVGLAVKAVTGRHQQCLFLRHQGSLKCFHG